MKLKWIVANLLGLLIILTGCATAPETVEPVPEEQTVEENVVVNTVQEIKPLSAEELEAAERAIERAENADAGTFSPELFSEAKNDFDSAKSIKDNDPDQARSLLKSSITKADSAYEDAVNNQIDQKIAKIKILESQLKEIEAELFAKNDYKIVKDRSNLLLEYLKNEDYENAEKQYAPTLRSMQNLYDTLDNNIKWIKILDRDTVAYMKDAEDQEVYIWSPEELEKANYSYAEGLSHFKNYDLNSSEKSLNEAKYWAYQSLRLSGERKRQSQTDLLMMEALESLENVSNDNTSNDSKTFIDDNPAPNTKPEEYTEDDSSLKEFDPDAEMSNDTNNATLLINGSTSVLGDEQEVSLLDQAVELWKLGVKARSEGKYDEADEFFKQSKVYSLAYSETKIDSEYTVKRYDTLWSISAKEEILNNPFLWTKIWRKNSNAIKNPDYIYPGQKLKIPSQ